MKEGQITVTVYSRWRFPFFLELLPFGAYLRLVSRDLMRAWARMTITLAWIEIRVDDGPWERPDIRFEFPDDDDDDDGDTPILAFAGART